MVTLPLLLVLGLCLRAFVATDKPRRRYAALPRAARIIYDRSEPIDFVLVGTSRTMYAVDEGLLAAGAAAGAVPVVEDLSHSWQADGQNFRSLRDLFRRRPVRQAVLYEISRRDDRQLYYHYYPNFAITTTFGDLLDDFASKPREPRLSRLRDLLELLLGRVDKGLALRLRGENKDAWGLGLVFWRPDERDPTRTKGSRMEKMRQKRRDIEAAHGSWDRAPATRWSLDDINEDRANHYLDRTIALCREQGVTLVFFHTPGYLDPPLSEETRRGFRERFGAPLLTPPVDVLARLYQIENFNDVYHINRPGGRPIYSAWLAQALQDQLRREDR